MARIISAFFLIALIMFATAKPLAHGQLLGGLLGGVGGLLGGLLDFLGTLLGGSLVPGGNPLPLPSTLSPVLSSTLPPLVQGLNINGRLCCTPTGNCNAAGSPPPLPGALVTLNCTGNEFANGSLVVGPVRTDINANFNVTVFNAVGSLRSIPSVIPCNITVNVDPLLCPVLSGVGGALGAVLPVVLRAVSVVLDTLGRVVLNISLGARV